MDYSWNELVIRVNWQYILRFLKENKLPTAQGSINTLLKIKERGIDIEPISSKLLYESILYNNKFGQILNLDAENHLSLMNFFIEKGKEKNISPIEIISNEGIHSALQDENKNIPTIISHHSSDQFEDILFYTIRKVRTRENIKSKLSSYSDSSTFIVNYEEIVGVKMDETIFFDILRFDKVNHTISLLIDNSRDIGVHQLESALNELQMKFIDYSQDIIDAQLLNAKNFFHLLDQIYSDSANGLVKEFGLITDTKSRKAETITITDKSDLRNETYHSDGKKNVLFDLYRLAVVWPSISEINCPPYLLIPGLTSCLTSKNKKGPIHFHHISYFHSKECFTFIQYKHINDVLHS